MKKKLPRINLRNLPGSAGEYIKSVIKKMRYRKKVRNEVLAELASDFEAELKDCNSEEQKQQRSRQFVEEFGDVKLLAVLLRRAKKRCRPLWRTIVARTFQIILVLIVFFIFYVGWFITGKPTISVDYIAQFNELSKPEISEQENAWQNYEKAMELYVEPNEAIEGIERLVSLSNHTGFEQLHEIQQKEIKRWINDNQPAWQQYVEAGRKPYFYTKYETGPREEEQLAVFILLPYIPPLRDLSISGIWQSRLMVSQGKIQEAIENCFAVIRTGNHFYSKESIIERLVGVALKRMGCEQIIKIIATKKPSLGEIKSLEQQLSALNLENDKDFDLTAERLMFLDVVQHMFTQGGPGGGHFVPKSMSILDGEIDYAEDILDFLDDYLEIFGGDKNAIKSAAYVSAGLLHAGRDDTLAQAYRLFDRQEELLKMTPYQMYLLNNGRELDDDELLSSLPEHKYFLIHWFSPSIRAISIRVNNERVINRALITILALEKWRIERGDYPEVLDELVEAGFLEQLPIDPWSDKPLVYKKSNDDFLLYGVGRNFKDDNGQVIRDNNGNIDLFAEEGDMVFWPVLKSD